MNIFSSSHNDPSPPTPYITNPSSTRATSDYTRSGITNTPGLTGLTKDVGDAISKDVGCAVSTRYTTVTLPRLQCTDAAHAFRKPFTFVMYVCIGKRYSKAIGNSRNVDKIVSVKVVILFCFYLGVRSVLMLISAITSIIVITRYQHQD